MTAVALLVPLAGAAQAAAAAPPTSPPAATAPSAALPAPAGDAPPGHDDDTVLVRFRPVLTEPGQEQVVAESGAQLGKDVGASGWTRVDTAGRDPEQVRAELARDPAVAEAELDPVRTTLATPNDPLYARQAGLGALRLPAAWDVTTGSTSTVIAVLDTGVDARHPDLAGRVLPGTDVVNRDGDPADDNGHGTGVAGVAAANAGNGVGVAGVDWKARVLPVKVLGSTGQGRDSDIAEGMRWAVDRGATVINLSLGGGGRSGVLTDAVEYALGRGVVVVAAAGNTGMQEESFPAAIPGVIAVAATDNSGAPATFSTTGPWVDVAAPGTGVATLGLSWSRSSYVAMTGTSFAAPLVSGVVGLVQARHPDWDAGRVHEWLRSTARDVAARGFDTRTG
ncbi:MAG: S8 family serine peptidase, partial [Actinomycetota bacterium]|nr:S8 family serine peptidase [Actinomycetota bacterium]